MKATLKNHFIASALIVIGVGGVVFGAIGAIDYYTATQTGDATPANEVVQQEMTVSEKVVQIQEGEYTVPAGAPRLIEIPKLGVRSYVQKIGVYSSGEMATPTNIHFAGWYIDSVAPGEIGRSIVNGHAGGRYADGVFKYLGTLSPGDNFRIQMGDFSWRDFSVVSLNVYSTEESAKALFDDDPDIERELRLITCDGNFDQASQTYDQRLIVVAAAL